MLNSSPSSIASPAGVVSSGEVRSCFAELDAMGTALGDRSIWEAVGAARVENAMVAKPAAAKSFVAGRCFSCLRMWSSLSGGPIGIEPVMPARKF